MKSVKWREPYGYDDVDITISEDFQRDAVVVLATAVDYKSDVVYQASEYIPKRKFLSTSSIEGREKIMANVSRDLKNRILSDMGIAGFEDYNEPKENINKQVFGTNVVDEIRTSQNMIWLDKRVNEIVMAGR